MHHNGLRLESTGFENLGKINLVSFSWSELSIIPRIGCFGIMFVSIKIRNKKLG
jgi:hypothetical protein